MRGGESLHKIGGGVGFVKKSRKGGGVAQKGGQRWLKKRRKMEKGYTGEGRQIKTTV